MHHAHLSRSKYYHNFNTNFRCCKASIDIEKTHVYVTVSRERFQFHVTSGFITSWVNFANDFVLVVFNNCGGMNIVVEGANFDHGGIVPLHVKIETVQASMSNFEPKVVKNELSVLSKNVELFDRHRFRWTLC